jgi:hypothetical protein
MLGKRGRRKTVPKKVKEEQRKLQNEDFRIWILSN